MLKQLITPMLLGLTLLQAKPFAVQVSVPAKKPGGFNWDLAGGAPDIYVVIQGRRFQIRQACRDTYQCTAAAITRYNAGDRIYLEIYDKDLTADDLITKGTCTIDPKRPCALRDTTVRFVTKRLEALQPLILADATQEVAAKQLQDINRTLIRRIDEMKRHGTISEDAIYRLIDTIDNYRDTFGRDLSPDVKQKLYEFLNRLRKNGVDKELIDMVDRYYRSSQSLSA